ncbi:MULTISPECIES: M16 family metallopeptidase [unclassified Methylophaga]|jgi:zinc protease|uniref:M16 family metallopeptidase n=1 Tax=unclassified Methylophaga TaxID=2629249 RepID=UPI000C8CFBD0|nr:MULTISPECIES: pitrilysin family protein [unclassified Methylophaga]MAP27190.1 peptidase M16 [Methylophaga sp.]HCO01426.1 peptidase M16 [Methylophaga sp.]|tara:strand:- start:64711 stop:66012 length:1302 start_codon:yes stop_codon:yes gene_type:complete
MLAKFSFLFTGLLLAFSVSASPQIENWQTANGTQVYFVKAQELPILDIRLVFDAGAARDPKGGVALLTSSMLNQGTKNKDTDAIATAFDDVGAEFSSESERDMAVLSLRTLSKADALQPAIDTFVEVISQPSFPERSFDRLINQVKTSLQSEKQSPSAIADRAFYQQLYDDHPYSSMPIGTEASIEEISIADLQQFYQQFYVANNAVLVIVGDVDIKQAKALSEKISGSLPAGKKAAALPEVEPLETAQQKNLPYPSSQTTILMGQPGLTRDDPDFFPLYVGNHVLGGSGLVSIISDEIREKRGLSYSAYSYFRPMREAGPYQFGLQTRNDQAELALEVLNQTLVDFVEQGPTKEQLTAAQKNITGGFALRLDSNSKIADYLAMMGFYQLPLDHLETFNSRVNAVTVDQIKAAYQKRIHPQKMVTILVGGDAE